MMCVSRAHCNMTLFLRHVAVQTRDRQKGGVCYGPGSAAHHERVRRRAQTAHAALRPGHTTDSLILGQAVRDRGLDVTPMEPSFSRSHDARFVKSHEISGFVLAKSWLRLRLP